MLHWEFLNSGDTASRPVRMICYLMDENADPIYRTQLLRREPDLVVWAVGDVGDRLKAKLEHKF